MLRFLRNIPRHVSWLSKATWRYLGPVTSAVRNQMTGAEWQRVATKAAVGWMTAKATLEATLHDAEFLAGVVLPTVFAGLIAFFDAAMHHQAGSDPTADAAILPPASEPPKS